MNVRNEEIVSWDDLQHLGWSGLLVGNGSSIAVWEDFRYDSIYEMASSEDIEHPLIEQDIELFNSFGTRNFERVLSALLTARAVNQSLGIEDEQIAPRYDSIRTALFEAVRSVHIPWHLLPDENKLLIQEALLNYDFVYSTNYDLILYWSILAQSGGEGFKDYFWNEDEGFDIGNTEVWQKVTKVLYLHGGIHLYRNAFGQTFKRRARNSGNLLDSVGDLYRDDSIPLFVSEGSSSQKLASILGSDYLSFAYSRLSLHEGPLVIFGHALDEESDSHIIDIIDNWRERDIAISINSNSDGRERIRRLANAHDAFPSANLHFFESNTHPLGVADLRVEPADE